MTEDAPISSETTPDQAAQRLLVNSLAVAGVVTGLFIVGLSLALQVQTAPPGEDLATPVDATPPPRDYIEVNQPVVSTLPIGGHTVQARIAVAVDAEAAPMLRAFAAMNPEDLIATLAPLMTRIAETAEDLDDLRAALPEAFAEDLNDRIEEAGAGRPVQEVFLTSFHTR